MKKNVRLLTLIMMIWFMISFISNILGPLIPDIINGFQLSNLAMAGFIPTFFFISYAIMSIPAGILIDKYGEKPILLSGVAMPLMGAFIFACFPSYSMLLFSCFIMGLGMAMIQTVLNPLQRLAGGEENYAFIAELGQLMFGIASFISPLVYTYLMTQLRTEGYADNKNVLIEFLSSITPLDLPWVSLYWIFVLLLFIIIIAVSFSRIPKIDSKEEKDAGTTASYLKLFKLPYVWLFFLGIFSYVSTEQGTSIFMSTFLEKYHGIDPQLTGARIVSYFWGCMTIGCIVGMVLLKLFDSKRILISSGFLASIFLLFALYGPTRISEIAFPAIGFSISMMFSIIFSLALNSVSEHHGSFSGILCSGLAGGAIGPLLVSNLADITDLRTGMLVILVFIAYITSIGFWAKPLINNKTVQLREIFKRKK